MSYLTLTLPAIYKSSSLEETPVTLKWVPPSDNDYRNSEGEFTISCSQPGAVFSLRIKVADFEKEMERIEKYSRDVISGPEKS